MELVSLVFRFVLAGVFIAAGLSKVRRRQAFVRTVQRYQMLPAEIARPLALGLPFFELGCGLLLLFGLGIVAAAALVGLALVVFCAAIAVNLIRGREMDCGCMTSVGPRRIGWPLVVRNAVLALGAALVVFESPQALSTEALIVSTDPAVPHSDGVAALLVSAFGLGIVALAGRSVRLARLVGRLQREAR